MLRFLPERLQRQRQLLLVQHAIYRIAPQQGCYEARVGLAWNRERGWNTPAMLADRLRRSSTTQCISQQPMEVVAECPQLENPLRHFFWGCIRRRELEFRSPIVTHDCAATGQASVRKHYRPHRHYHFRPRARCATMSSPPTVTAPETAADVTTSHRPTGTRGPSIAR